MTESSKRFRSRIALLVGAVLLSACAGENLFTLTGVSGSGPQIEITQPAAGATRSLGDSVLVQANISSTVGIGTVTINGRYAGGGTAAYGPFTGSYPGLVTTSPSTYLSALAGQVVGDVYIVVEATDQGGTTAADSVKITIN